MKTGRHIFSSVMLLAMTAILLSSCEALTGQYTLFNGQKSQYTIFLPQDASASERSAAEDLQKTIQQMGGPELAITDTQTGNHQILVGVAPEGCEKPEKEDETFTYRTAGSNLYIYGGSLRGTMYGVYRFMEKEMGVRWYTPQCTVIPETGKFTFGKLDVTQKPGLPYRQLDYFNVASDPEWLAHNLVNTNHNPQENKWGNLESYFGCHTMPAFVPYSLFDEHPEYFCMRDGKRKTGQLCLSNPDVLQMCKEGVLQRMRNNPLPRIYSLSQDDNYEFCTCPECQKIEAKYGGQHSGLMIWFVNQVADYVKDEFPDKFIGTFAYQWTRTPPTGITPRDNVVVRLCSIECCYAHPFESEGCPQNETFVKDLQTWGEVAPHLFIWDYVVDYAQYMAAWPNFQVLAQNIRTLRDNHAIGVYEESCYHGNATEFSDMKAWVLAQLLWNPDQDVDPLVNDFIKGYYGETADYIRQYYDLCQGLIKPDLHFNIYIYHDNELYTEEFITKSTEVLNKAREAAQSDEMRNRVDIVRLQILYLQCMRNFKQCREDGTWEEMKGIALRNNSRPREWQTMEQYIAEMEAKE